MSELRLDGIDDLQARLERLISDIPGAEAAAAVAAVERVRDVMLGQFIGGSAIGRETGALADGWKIERQSDPPAAILSTAQPYAKAQEYGSMRIVQVRPHRRKGAPVRGHPMKMNLRPRSFLRGAIEAARPELRGTVFDAWRREIAE